MPRKRRGEMRPGFDGREDSDFYPFDVAGRSDLEYIRFHGEFDDMPLERFSTEMRAASPRMLAALQEERAERARAG